MNEKIKILQEFLTRGEIRLYRNDVMYQILSVDDNGQSEAIKNPLYERTHVPMTLTEKEITELANICFPAVRRTT